MTIGIGRREFISALGGAAAAWPLAAHAQQPTMPVIGILASASPDANAIRLRAFRDGLRGAGYVEGQNVNIEYRWAEAHTDRLPELAAQLVHRSGGRTCSRRWHCFGPGGEGGDTSIPIVFGIGADPVERWTCRQP